MFFLKHKSSPCSIYGMKLLMITLLPAFVLAGCGISPVSDSRNSGGKEPEIFIAAEWNVQALFDGQETGNEYGEYRETEGWTAEKYQARLLSLSKAIQLMAVNDSGAKAPPSGKIPDLIGFAELENAGILSRIASDTLSEYGYYWTAFGNLPGSPLGIGFVSRYPIKDVRVHSITVGNETAPRPILEIRLEPNEQALVFLLCHWKSKLGNENTARALRRASARVVQRRLFELKETEPETPVIVMGDLNENHDEFYRYAATAKPGKAEKPLFPLLPDDADAALLALKYGNPGEFLVLTGNKPPFATFFPENTTALYSPWKHDISPGTYFFRDKWETIDHFLLSVQLFDGKGWEYSLCKIASHEPFTTPEGTPNAYIPRTGRGLSDHLPLLLYLTYKP